MDKNNYKIISCLLFNIFIINTEINSIVLAINAICSQLKIDMPYAHWLSSSYMICFAAFVILAGKAGDLYGHYSAVKIGNILLILTCLIGGFCKSYSSLIVIRSLQGMSAAIVWPNAFALALNKSSIKNRNMVISLLTSAVGLAIAVGPLISGLIMTYLTWKWCFWIYVPFIGGLYLILDHYFKGSKNSPRLELLSIDYIGATILLVCLGLLLSSIQLIPLFYTNSRQIYILSACGILGFIFFTYWESQVISPIINFNILMRRDFLKGVITRLIMQANFMGLTFAIMLYFQVVLHYTPMKTAVLFLPCTGFIFLLSPLIGNIMSKTSPLNLFNCSSLLSFIFYFLLSRFNILHSHLFLLVVLVGVGVTYTIMSTSLFGVTFDKISNNDRGQATGMYFMFSVVGNAVGYAISTPILTAHHEYSIPLGVTMSNQFSTLMFIFSLMALSGFMLINFRENLLARWH